MLTVPFVLALVIDIGITAAWLYWLHSRDIHSVKKGQGGVVLRYFLAGLLAYPVFLLVYRVNPYRAIAGSEAAYRFLVAASSEEAAKFLVFWLLARTTRSVKEPLDAAIQGASVGLGFAAVENLFRASSGFGGIPALGSLTALAGHGVYAATAAFAWGAADYYLGRTGRAGVWGYATLGLTAACLSHGIHNLLGSLGRDGLFLTLALDAVFFFLFAFFLSDARRLSPYYTFPLGRWKEAVRWIDHGLARDPDNWILHQRKGMYLLRGPDPAEAGRCFSRAAVLSGDPVPHAWAAALRRLEGRADAGELAAAVEAIPPARRESFLTAFRNVAGGLSPGDRLTVEIASIVEPPEPTPPPAWDALPGYMDRSPEALARARELREKSRRLRDRRLVI